MKKTLLLFLAALLLLCPLASCKKEGEGDGDALPAESFSLEFEDIDFISLCRYALPESESGRAMLTSKEHLGIILQLKDELEAVVLTPLLPTDPRVFDDSDVIDINVYGKTSNQTISIDKNDLVRAGSRTCFITEGPLSYKHIKAYYDEFLEK